MRLIDSDALIKKALDEAFFDSAAEDIFCELVETAPTVYAVEVVHGRWVDNGIPESMLSKCTVCGFPCGACTFNFCPNCGAKMDGERSEP